MAYSKYQQKMQENAKIRKIKGIQQLMCSQIEEIQKSKILKIDLDT